LEINTEDKFFFKAVPNGLDNTLKCKRRYEELINRITDITDIYVMKELPKYKFSYASCKFATSVIK